MGSGLVKDGIWRSVRHVNYLGDLMRLHELQRHGWGVWAFLLPGVITLLYLQRINQKEQAMAAKIS